MEENFDATPCPVKAGRKPNRKMVPNCRGRNVTVKQSGQKRRQETTGNQV